MPKEIRSAADILGAAPAAVAEESPSSLPPDTTAVVEAPEQAAGFESPPPAEEAAAAPGAEAAPSAESVLAEVAAPAPAPAMAKEMVIPAKPETLLNPPGEPTPIEAPNPAPPVAVKAPAIFEKRFVKNIHFGETLVFQDGSTHVFKRAIEIVRDRVLAEKILAVAKKYNIVEQ